jgi:hypothetical protein
MKHTALGPAPAEPAAPGASAACQTAVDRHIEGRAVLNSAGLAHNPEVAGSNPAPLPGQRPLPIMEGASGCGLCTCACAQPCSVAH